MVLAASSAGVAVARALVAAARASAAGWNALYRSNEQLARAAVTEARVAPEGGPSLVAEPPAPPVALPPAPPVPPTPPAPPAPPGALESMVSFPRFFDFQPASNTPARASQPTMGRAVFAQNARATIAGS
jgi:hypothetical protein